MTSTTQSSGRINFSGLQLRSMDRGHVLEFLARAYPHGGGLMELSFRPTQAYQVTAAIYNAKSNSHEEADFDIDSGQPVPNGEVADISQFRQISPLEVIAFRGFHNGGPSQFVGFLVRGRARTLAG